jgi:hypothetical protein
VASDGQYVGSWQPGDADHPFKRYAFRLEHFDRSDMPMPFEETRLRVCTAGGEHKAAAMAAMALRSRLGDVVIFTVELETVEDDYAPDPESDIIQYWEVA